MNWEGSTPENPRRTEGGQLAMRNKQGAGKEGGGTEFEEFSLIPQKPSFSTLADPTQAGGSPTEGTLGLISTLG